MTEILLIMLAGVITGFFLRNRNKVTGVVDKLIIVSIIFLLFSLGFAVGGDPVIISNLPSLGLTALALSLAGILGSLIMAMLLWRFYFKDSHKE